MSRTFAYASTVDILSHLSFVATFTNNSKPNATQAHTQLLNASDEIDTVLGEAGYTTPIATGATQSGELLRHWTGLGAAMYVAYSMPQGQDSKHAATLERRFNIILDGIRSGALTLPTDSPLDSNTSLACYAAPDVLTGSPYFHRGFADGF